MTSAYDRLNRQLPTAADNTPIEQLTAAKTIVDRLGLLFAA
jgi:hypothetical protein